MKGLAIFIAVLLAASAFGATLVLQPGPEGKDNMLVDTQPTRNWGSYAYITVNWAGGCEDRGIVDFEGLSAIPKGSTVNSAKLQLYNWANNPNDKFTIHRITESWTETGSYWNNQPKHDAKVYAEVLVTGSGTYSFDVKALVQEWVKGTYPNYGFMLKRPSGRRTSWPYFASSDHGTSTWRPKLTVDYDPSAIAPASVGRVKALFR